MSEDDFICKEEMQHELEEQELLGTLSDSPSPSSPKPSISKGTKRKRVPTTIRCHLCPRYSCKTFETYKRHLKLHAAEDLYKSAPAIDVAVEQFRPEAKSLLLKMQSAEYSSELRQMCCDIAVQLYTQAERTSTGFIDLVIMELWACFPPVSRIEPSVLNSTYVHNVSHLLADSNKRNSFRASLKDIISPLDCLKPGRVIDWFVCEFVRLLSEAVETFYLRVLQNPREVILQQSRQNHLEDEEDYLVGGDHENRTTDSGEDAENRSTKFKQTIHYIGGSAVRSTLRLALRSTGNEKWDHIYSCLKKRFMCGGLVDGVEEEIGKWTETRSRGGLTFVSEPCWCFFMALSRIVKKNGKKIDP